ncbi:MAG: DNA polymerase Y family protein [Proteobacteria bacterium]|nr:DNA polymerase Y family protein [Pseudomonadota bacterium]
MKPIQKSLFVQLPPTKPLPAVRARPTPTTPLQQRSQQWLAVHLPFLPLEALSHESDSTTPRAVTDPDAGVARILAATAAAHDEGVVPGMTLAAAWSLLPELVIQERDVQRERQCMQRLVVRANRFTPMVCIDGENLLLEVRGSMQLFAGEARLMKAVKSDITGTGFTAHIAMAPAARAAIWLARAEREVCVKQVEMLPNVLGELPLSATGFDTDLLEKLAGVGARCIRDVLRLPREGFARRYGVRILRELDQATGRDADVRKPVSLPRKFATRCNLDYEISDAGRLLHPVLQLLCELDGYLQGTQQGVSRLQLRLFHRDRTFTDIMIGFAEATRDATRIEDLVEQRFETLELPAPVLDIHLVARELHALTGRDRNLFIDDQQHDDDGEGGWPQLVERLIMRLGNAAVRGIEQREDHRPERAWRFVVPGTAREKPGRAGRPQWLLETPQALQTKNGQPLNNHGPLELVDGPERIETGWWDEADVARDYFIARDAHGRKLWVCREVRTGRWWVQGLFA